MPILNEERFRRRMKCRSGRAGVEAIRTPFVTTPTAFMWWLRAASRTARNALCSGGKAVVRNNHPHGPRSVGAVLC